MNCFASMRAFLNAKNIFLQADKISFQPPEYIANTTHNKNGDQLMTLTTIWEEIHFESSNIAIDKPRISQINGNNPPYNKKISYFLLSEFLMFFVTETISLQPKSTI